MEKQRFLIKQTGVADKYYVHIGNVIDWDVSKSMALRAGAFKTLEHAQAELQLAKDTVKKRVCFSRAKFDIVAA